MYQRIRSSAYMQDVRSRLHIIPETMGGVAALYVLWGLVHLGAVAQAWAVGR
jgi:hypothetical protein